LILLRSAVFNLLFYAAFLLVLVGGLVFYPLPRLWPMRLGQAWARFSLWLMRWVVGIRTEFRGLDRIPKGPLLVAAKHQSMWETFALVTLFPDPVFILKRELISIPVFGWWMSRLRMIPVNRGARSAALVGVAARAREELGRDRQILIFPEGTRRSPGDVPAYKFGVAFLYSELDVPCVPVALNSGLFWPRRTFRRYPGTIVAEILDPISPGLERKAFATLLQAQIEAASDRLLLEAAAMPAAPPMPETARSRLAALAAEGTARMGEDLSAKPAA